MDIHSITFPPGTSGVAEIIAGPTKRSYRTTTHAVAMALLGSQNEDETAASQAGEIIWQDFLATHGIAVGTRGKRSYILAVSPSRERTVSYVGPRDVAGAGNLTVQYPPILFGMAREGTGPKSFRKAVVFVLGSSDLSRLSVTGTGNVGVAFPYGNVYNTTGYVCWGTTPHMHVQSVKDMEDLFFGSSFNGDLYGMSAGRLDTLAEKYKGKALPLNVAPNASIPAIIRYLTV